MKKPEDFECKLGGKVWHVKFVRRGHPKLEGNLGMCYRYDRELYVRYDVAEKTFMDILIHEIQHSLTDMHFYAEGWVEETSTEIAEALLKAGLGVKGGRTSKV